MHCFRQLVCAIGVISIAANAGFACVGDCSVDGEVTVDELILGVSIALGTATLEQCGAIDANQDRQVTVDEILNAVNAILVGCASDDGPRVIALSRDGKIASLDITAPWAVRASSDLGADISSARCRADRCIVVHPSTDSLSIVDPIDLSSETHVFERDSGLRDVAQIDDHRIIVSLHNLPEVLEVDLTSGAVTPIDLSVLADEDGIPEALRMAHCGERVFVQLRRVDHETEAPSTLGPGLAVIDLSRTGSERLIDADPNTPGVQAIALAGKPNFDMPVDCEAGRLLIAEPALLMQGGGSYEQVDLTTLTASELPIDTNAEVGGFEFVGGQQYWLITHTTTGPAPSSHLNLIGGGSPDTYNAFADEHVNDLALDLPTNSLFFPDPCVLSPRNPGCQTGVQVFDAHSGERLTDPAIDVGFAPIEIVIAR